MKGREEIKIAKTTHNANGSAFVGAYGAQLKTAVGMVAGVYNGFLQLLLECAERGFGSR